MSVRMGRSIVWLGLVGSVWASAILYRLQPVAGKHNAFSMNDPVDKLF